MLRISTEKICASLELRVIFFKEPFIVLYILFCCQKNLNFKNLEKLLNKNCKQYMHNCLVERQNYFKKQFCDLQCNFPQLNFIIGWFDMHQAGLQFSRCCN